MPPFSAALRLVAAALAANAAVALTAVLYQDLGACATPAGGMTISAFTDVCAPQLGAVASPMAGVPQSFAIKSGSTSTSATFIGFIGKKDCTGDPTAFSLTLTTTSCTMLPGAFGALGYYAKLSATDVAVTAASVGGAAYVPFYAASTCIPAALVADIVNSGEGRAVRSRSAHCAAVCTVRRIPVSEQQLGFLCGLREQNSLSCFASRSLTPLLPSPLAQPSPAPRCRAHHT